MRRSFAIALLLAVMAAFAFGVNRFFASRKTTIASAAAPTHVHAAFTVPGTLYLAQNGDIYRLNDGAFADLHLPSSIGTWMQPAIVPGTSDILAVARTDAYSDVYLIDGATGRILRQLSHNKTTSKTLQLNHWMFWPRVSADGNTMFVSYDAPKSDQSYEIDFAIWQGSVNGAVAARQWTEPNGYTGGDVDAVPLAGGGLLYSKYAIDGGNVFSQIAVQTRAMAVPAFLTSATADCSQPELSPDGTAMTMICANGTGLQSTSLVVAPYNGHTLGTARVLVANCVCSAPVWAPDGSGLVFYEPADATGQFELWWVAHAAAAAPSAPRRLTTGLDFDAASPPAWAA